MSIMQYTSLGRTGLVVSRLALGSMTFGTGEMVPGVINKIDQSIANEMVNAALDAGINLFDTADAYTGGQSEVILGQALKSRRQEAIISTKVGFRTGNNLTETGLSYGHIISAAQASLKRLGTDYIDLYQIHIPDPLTPPAETLRALEDLIRRGMVRYVGFSNLPAWKAARMLAIQEDRGYTQFAVAQMYYSLLGRDIEYEIVPFVQDSGIGILAWSPLASGFLTGKYRDGNNDDARRDKFQFPPVDLDLGDRVLGLLDQVARDRGVSLSQVAIAWILSKPFVSSVIIGANKIQQLHENLAAVELTLSTLELEQLDLLTTPPPIYPIWMQPMGWDARIKAALNPDRS
jgi:aryl-alcohol dehydrogenase-like predicted oxidoreductase